MSGPKVAPARRKLPRHVIGAAWVAAGFVGGIALLLVLPRLGVPPKAAGLIGMVTWLASTWMFWSGGEPPTKPEPPQEPS
jgi:hypothetical protein